MFRGTAHVVLGSGLTIAGATFCLHFTRLPYFQSLGVPLAIGMVICVLAALTLGSAVVTVASRFGKMLEPKRAMRTRGWRKIGAAVVRWPGPILVGHDRALTGRSAHAAGLPDQLQRPQLPAGRPARQRGVRGRRPALLAGPDEPRAAADRERSRSAQLGGLPGDRQDRQGHLQGAGHRPGAGDHAAAGNADRAHLDPVPDQHAGHDAEDEREVQAGHDGQHAQAGRRHADDHRHDDEDVGAHCSRWPTSRTRWSRR